MSEVNIGDSFKLDLDKLGVGQQSGNGYGQINFTEAEKSIFDVLDTHKNGKLDSEEIQALKNNMAEYIADGDFSKKDAKKMAKKMGLKCGGEVLMSFIQKLLGGSTRNESVVNKDGNTVVTDKSGTEFVYDSEGNLLSKTLHSNRDGMERTQTNDAETGEITITVNNPETGEHMKQVQNQQGKLISYHTESSDGSYRDIEYQIGADGESYPSYTSYVNNSTNTSGTIGYDDAGQMEWQNITHTDTGMEEHFEYQYVDGTCKVQRRVVTNANGDELVYGSDGQALFFRLKDDRTMYPNLGSWLIDEFNKGENISQYLSAWNE